LLIIPFLLAFHSSTDDEFVQRFKDARKLTDLLKQQEALGDSRVAQLKHELESLRGAQQNLLDDGSDETAPNPVAETDYTGVESTSGHGVNVKDSRYFDSQIFNTEIRVQQIQRQLAKNGTRINEVRTGVGHLMTLLVTNSKLLHNLPRTKTPRLESNDDILTCLSWCEEVRTEIYACKLRNMLIFAMNALISANLLPSPPYPPPPTPPPFLNSHFVV